MQTSALNFIYFLAAIGAIYFILFLIKVLWGLLKLIIPSKNLRESYGENCWAVVTGASDGIGLGFCEELAAAGINLCLIARNTAKLTKVAEQLSSANPSIQTRIITADFTDSQQEGFFERILEGLGDIDVGILVNNVGISNVGILHQIPLERLLNEINVNCVSMVALTNLLAQRMVRRQPRSAIINISSIAGTLPTPYIAVYSATKAFNDYFSKATGMEYDDKIDILSVQPMYVQSNMSKVAAGPGVATRNQCASAALKSLGLEYETNGWWRHRFFSYVMFRLPMFLLRILLKSQSKKMMEEEKSRGAA